MGNYKKRVPISEERPVYLSPDGTVDIAKAWTFQPKQQELHRDIVINGNTYRTLAAAQCLLVGGMRGGKTTGALMFGVINFCLAFSYCDILVLRRTFKELESGAIADMKAFVPSELYTYDQTKHVATFGNGSRIVFGHCQNNKERDILAYLGQAYPYILVDECAQFSPEAWMLLNARNAVNAACIPDSFGNLPMACMVGCTNPMGIHWNYYHTIWVKKEPWEKSETAKRDFNGNWWELETGEPVCVYNTADYAYSESTAMDNPIFIKRNPGWVAMMMAKPKALRDKWLYGVLDKVEGQYFDCWSEEFHVINLREDPDAVKWQEWQPVWAGGDWGMGHANSTYLFTKALVRSSTDENKYSMKTVCFREIVVPGNKTYRELAANISAVAKYPDGKPCKVSAFYFSHEKFNRVMDAHSPADEYSRELEKYGLPAVTRGTQDRIGSASFLYNELKNGRLVIMDYCVEIINAIPRLQRNPENLDDVLKTNNKSDDAYDGFRLGLYGQLGVKQRPQRDVIAEHASTLDPIAKHFYLMKKNQELAAQSSCWSDSKSDYVPDRRFY